MLKGQIACLFSGGWTEVGNGAMERFLEKINADYKYVKCFPKTIKTRNGNIVLNPSSNGITGDALITKVKDYLIKNKELFKNYKAILIEDDLDGRFDKVSLSQVQADIQTLKDDLRTCVGLPDIPVVILYASPEIESWFIADWNNGFEFFVNNSRRFQDIDSSIRGKFNHDFRKTVNKNLLNNNAIDIEDYAFATGAYKKLSSDLQNLINNLSIQFTSKTGQDICISYSKKEDGKEMLRNILPSEVSKCCTKYFKMSALELQKL